MKFCFFKFFLNIFIVGSFLGYFSINFCCGGFCEPSFTLQNSSEKTIYKETNVSKTEKLEKFPVVLCKFRAHVPPLEDYDYSKDTAEEDCESEKGSEKLKI